MLWSLCALSAIAGTGVASLAATVIRARTDLCLLLLSLHRHTFSPRVAYSAAQAATCGQMAYFDCKNALDQAGKLLARAHISAWLEEEPSENHAALPLFCSWQNSRRHV